MKDGQLRNYVFITINVLVILAIMISYFELPWEDVSGESSRTIYFATISSAILITAVLRVYLVRKGYLA